jgi:hypothetical protein
MMTLDEVKKKHLDKYKKFPVGTEVGELGSYPYGACHVDCWGKPWKGIVISEYDPIVWHGTLAFPGQAVQSEVRELVENNMRLEARREEEYYNRVPVLMFYTDDPDDPKRCITSIRWSEIDKLVPYKIAVKTWRIDRAVERKRLREQKKLARGVRKVKGNG